MLVFLSMRPFQQIEGYGSHFIVSHLAGDEGFEPPITGPEPVALPLGQSPVGLIVEISTDER